MKREQLVHVVLDSTGGPAQVILDLSKAKGVIYHPDGKTVEMVISRGGSPDFAPVVPAALLWDDGKPVVGVDMAGGPDRPVEVFWCGACGKVHRTTDLLPENHP